MLKILKESICKPLPIGASLQQYRDGRTDTTNQILHELASIHLELKTISQFLLRKMGFYSFYYSLCFWQVNLWKERYNNKTFAKTLYGRIILDILDISLGYYWFDFSKFARMNSCLFNISSHSYQQYKIYVALFCALFQVAIMCKLFFLDACTMYILEVKLW